MVNARTEFESSTSLVSKPSLEEVFSAASDAVRCLTGDYNSGINQTRVWPRRDEQRDSS